MKKVINKYILSLFIVFLTLLTIFLTGFFILKNYKQILEAFNIKIEENCQYKDKKLECEYINIKSKNLKANIKKLSLEIYAKKFFTGDKFIFLNVDYVKIQISKRKKSKKHEKFNINNIKKILRYSYFLLGRSEIKLNNLDITIKNGKFFAVKGLSLENINNQFYTLKPFKLIIDNKETEITNFYGELDPLTSSLNIYSLQFTGYNTEFVFTGSYRIDGHITLSGHTFTENYKIRNIKLSDFETFFDIEITPTKRASYNVDYSLKSIEILDKNIKGFEINGNINGKYYKNAEGILKLNINKAEFNKHTADNLSLLSSFKINIPDFNFYSKNKLKIKKFEDKYITVNDLNFNFITKKFPKLNINGDFDINNIKGRFSFKENDNVFIETSVFNLSKVLSWTKNLPPKLNELDSKLSLKLNFEIPTKIITSNVVLSNVNLFGIDFKNGLVNINYNLSNFSGNYKINLLNKNSFLNIFADSKKDIINGDFEYKNINIANLVFTRNQKILSVFTGKGNIYGSLKNPQIITDGTANYFFYDEIKITTPIRYNLTFKNYTFDINADSKNINSAIKIALNPFFIDINADTKKLNGDVVYYYLLKLQPNIFKTLKPKEITGKIRVVYTNGCYFVNLNISDTKTLLIPLDSYFKSNVKGYISSGLNSLDISFNKKDFLYKNFHIAYIKGKGKLLDKKFSLSVKARGSKNLDLFKFKGLLNLNLKSKSIKANTDISLRKNKYKYLANIVIEGNINNFSGNLNYKLLTDKNKISSSKISIKFKENSNYHLTLLSKEIPFNFEKKLISILKNVKYDIYITKDGQFDSYLYIDNLNVNLSRINLLNSRGILAKIDKNTFSLYPTSFTGVLEGETSLFKYKFRENYLIVKSKGKVNKQAISQIVQLLSIYGNIGYEFSFNGNVKNFLEKAYLKLYSNNLKIKSNYILGYVKIKNLLGIYKSKQLQISIEGKNSFITYGENLIKIKGNINIGTKPVEIKTLIATSLFPVKYSNIFIGNINSNLYLRYGKSKTVKGNISVSGQINLSTESMLKKSSTSPKNENLKQIDLDININSYLPVYIYGNWGKAYAEIKGNISGNAANPIFNGEINIIYGKITYLRNNYNIDFANIKIINNIPYINARISTIVANTYIFVNITGAAPDNLSFTFNSTPPKSKEEIMAILLLKNTPGALESIPVFSAVGKLILSVFPVNKFLPSEEETAGFLNTGFEVAIAPRYSPTEGITASIYAKRNLTRRIFIAISRPISQTTQTTYLGWYEAGIKLTESISILGRNYENNINELNLIFSLPFDF